MTSRGAPFPARLPFLAPLPLLVLLTFRAGAGEDAFAITPSEIQILDRAIASPDARTRADLVNLKNRLLALQAAAQEKDRQQALAPLAADAAFAAVREKLEAAAGQGGRAELRSLALFHLFMNETEKAREEWLRLGRANAHDLSHLLISAYLGLSLGEYGAARADLSDALSRMEARAGLEVSPPRFCTSIVGYRLFVPRRDGSLLPGEDTLIYAEVEGAEFAATAEGRSCRLVFGLRLRDGDQRTLWAEPGYGEYAPVFSGPVRDLHVALTWRVPNSLEPGRYRLLVEAVDEISSRRGESAISFQVGKRETNPGKRTTVTLPPPEPPARAPFGGANAPPDPSRAPGRGVFDSREFELLRDFERGRRVN